MRIWKVHLECYVPTSTVMSGLVNASLEAVVSEVDGRSSSSTLLTQVGTPRARRAAPWLTVAYGLSRQRRVPRRKMNLFGVRFNKAVARE